MTLWRCNLYRSLLISKSVCCFARQTARKNGFGRRRRHIITPGSEDVPPVLEDNAAGRSPFLLTSDHYGRADPAQPRRSRAAGRRADAAYRLGYRHCRRRRRAVETSRRASDRAALFAAGDRLQPPAGRGKFDPAHQRSDRHSRQRRPRARGRRGAARGDLRSLPSPHRRGDRPRACAMACRRCWCRCTASRRSMPASRGPGISARSIIATPDCRRCC